MRISCSCILNFVFLSYYIGSELSVEPVYSATKDGLVSTQTESLLRPPPKTPNSEDINIDDFIDNLSWDSAKKLLKKSLVQRLGADSEQSIKDFTLKLSEKLSEEGNKPSTTKQQGEGEGFDIFDDIERLFDPVQLKKAKKDIQSDLIGPIWDRYTDDLEKVLQDAIAEVDQEEELSEKNSQDFVLDPEEIRNLYNATTSEGKGELGPSDSSNSTLLSGISLRDLITVERCAGTERSHTTTCFCTKVKQWSCPAGSFCLAPNSPRPCPLGFYCPENTFQPSFCCGGYYCPTSDQILLCPAGHYCQEGSIAPRRCYFGHCPSGSKTIRKYEVFLFFLFFLVVVWVGQSLRARQIVQERHSQSRQRSRLEASVRPILTQGIPKFDIKFENLGLQLADGTVIMQGVSGQLQAGRTCAIMGPSGAGKTTLVSLLTGKVSKTSGTIWVNDVESTLAPFRKLVGFVPQEDIMLRKLTPEEILSHAAGLRLPGDWTSLQRQAKVMSTIEYLGLRKVMHQPIGDEEQRGVSGGQRKRVNIGMELVAEPAVLFLDEPTSGLDSSTSVEVCGLLSKVAKDQGLNVAAVIHSPSPAAFSLFDDLILLGIGGRLIYHGIADAAICYFEKMGFPCPPSVAPADHFMDIASGKVDNVYFDKFPVASLPDLWASYKADNIDIKQFVLSFQNANYYGGQSTEEIDFLVNQEGPANSYSDDNQKNKRQTTLISVWRWWKLTCVRTFSSFIRYIAILFLDIFCWYKSVFEEIIETIRSLITWRKPAPVRSTPGFFRIFKLCFYRSMIQIFRPPLSFVFDQLLHLGCGLFISIAAQNSVFLGPLPEVICNVTPLPLYIKCKRPIIDQAAQIGNFVSWGIGFAGIAVGAGTFGNERVVFWREASWGTPAMPYFAAKALADIPRQMVAALMFTLSLVAVYPNAAPFHQLYAIVYVLYYWGFSAGYLISALVKKEKAPLVGVAVALFWALVFSGVQPTLQEIKAVWGPDVLWLWSISAPRWAIAAFYIVETESPSRSYMDPGMVGRRWFGYHQDTFLGNLGNVLAIGMAWKLLAFIAFKLSNRDRMN